jgi:cytoskeletal protein CcmA (bactofilin family)
MAWMRQKSDAETKASDQPATATPPNTPAKRSGRETRMEKLVNIGQSVQIKGELTGNEDLTIEGLVDGKILVKDHSLTIGANGRITAEVHAKTVMVVGTINGNITADDKVEIAPSGTVNGDIRAPRVSISDGAKFKGSIDMDRKGAAAKASTSTSTSTSAPKPTGVSTPRTEMPRSASPSEN